MPNGIRPSHSSQSCSRHHTPSSSAKHRRGMSPDAERERPLSPKRQAGESSSKRFGIVKNHYDRQSAVPYTALQIPAVAERASSSQTSASTRAALRAWQNAPNLTKLEFEQRVKAAEIILLACSGPNRAANESDVLVIQGDLDLSGYDELTELPKKLNKIRGNLKLGGCHKLRELPSPLEVDGDLILIGCTHLAGLPERLIVLKTINCTECISFVNLPNAVVVGKDLILVGCIKLEYLTRATLRIDGNLVLNGCISLRKLSGQLQIRNDIYLIDCISLPSLPMSLGLGGDIYCEGCAILSKLPADMLTWGCRVDGRMRVVSLSRTALWPNEHEVERYERAGIKVLFDQDSATQLLPEYVGLSSAATLWHTMMPELSMPNPSRWRRMTIRKDEYDITTEDRQQLCRFLRRTFGTNDERLQAKPKRLAQRMHELLQAMDKDREVRGRCIDRMFDALIERDTNCWWIFAQVEDAMRPESLTQTSRHYSLGAAVALWQTMAPQLPMPDPSRWRHIIADGKQRDITAADHSMLFRFLFRTFGTSNERCQASPKMLGTRMQNLLQAMDEDIELRGRCINLMGHALRTTEVDCRWIFAKVEQATRVGRWIEEVS